MGTVICPRCGASVFAFHSLNTVEIKGVQEFERCQQMRNVLGDGEVVDDPLECEVLESAVEAAIARAP